MEKWLYPRIHAVFDALIQVECSLRGMASLLHDLGQRHRPWLESWHYLPPITVLEYVREREAFEQERQVRAALDSTGHSGLSDADSFWTWWMDVRQKSVKAKLAVIEAEPDLDAGEVNLLKRHSTLIREALLRAETTTNLHLSLGWNIFKYPATTPTDMLSGAALIYDWVERLRPVAQRTAEGWTWPLRPFDPTCKESVTNKNSDAARLAELVRSLISDWSPASPNWDTVEELLRIVGTTARVEMTIAGLYQCIRLGAPKIVAHLGGGPVATNRSSAVALFSENYEDQSESQSEEALPLKTPTRTQVLAGLPNEAMFTSSDLAKKMALEPESLRKRLDRWRKANAGGSGFVEDSEATSREPRYLYNVGSVRELLAHACTSGERPAKK